MMVLPHAALLHAAVTAVRAMADGVVLLKVWAAQHGLGCTSHAADGVDGHGLALLAAHLHATGQLVSELLCAA
jgi:hypothetical protein